MTSIELLSKACRDTDETSRKQGGEKYQGFESGELRDGGREVLES
jgi:hypothetical protein